MPTSSSSNLRVSGKTLKKIKKSKKSRSKTKRNKKHLNKTLGLLPKNQLKTRQYYYSQASSYVSKMQDGKVEEHGLEVVDSSDRDNMLVRKMNNGKVVESMIPK